MRWLDGITELNGHEFEQAPEDGDGQGSLVCSSPWDSILLDQAQKKKKKIHCSPAKTVIKLQWFRKSWDSQTRYVNWNKAGDSGKSPKQQVKMSE